MVFQWYLFVLLAAVAIFASAAGQTYTIEVHGRREVRYSWVPVLIIMIPLIYLAGTRANIGDTAAYRISFHNMSTSFSELLDALAGESKDKGFTVFTFFLKSIVGDNDKVYFTIIATICLMCVAVVYKKHSCNFIMSMFLFIASSDYVQWNYNGMRQFIAVAVIFAASDLLLKKKYVWYYAIILVMSAIHASALIMIPISLVVQGRPWNTRTVLFTVAALLAINFSSGLRDLITEFMSETQYSGEVGQFLETDGTNIFRVLVFCIPPVMALAFRSYLLPANDPVLDLATNMSIISMGMYIVSSVTSGIFIGRIPIFFSLHNYILLPWLIENVFDKRSQKLVYAIVIVCYLAFYWYQMTTAWDFSEFM